MRRIILLLSLAISVITAALLFGLIALSSIGCSGTSDGEPAESPPIVLIDLGTLRADHLGSYGHPRDPSPELDALARRPLWDVGLDFDHGTGHGVGSYLSVHEGPQRISSAFARPQL